MRTTREPGSADRCEGTHAISCPRTLSAGEPYAVLSSTPGNVSPIFRTVSKSILVLGILQRDSVELSVSSLPRGGDEPRVRRPARQRLSHYICQSTSPAARDECE